MRAALRTGALIVALGAFVFASRARPAAAGEYNPTLSIGDAAPAWSELPGVDGKSHSLSDLKESKAVVLVFTCNSCPYAVDYEDRIIALAREFKPRGVAVVAVNVNNIPEDRLDKMRERAQEKKFNFAYLYDSSQKIARDYGATYTPEFFVLDQHRRIAYMGALDDSPAADKVQQRYVAEALEAVLGGGEVKTAETVAIGCRIRMDRRRRSRSR